MKKLVIYLALMTMFCIGAQSALAIVWTGANSTDWFDGGNWVGGAAPGVADFAQIQFAENVSGTPVVNFPVIPATMTASVIGARIPDNGDTAVQNAMLSHVIANGNAARSSLTILGTLNTTDSTHNSGSNPSIGFDLTIDGGTWNATGSNGNLQLRQSYNSTANGSTPAFQIEVMNGGQINLEGRLRSTDAAARGFMRISGNSNVSVGWLQMPPTATDREFFIDIEPGSWLDSTNSTQATPGDSWFTNLASIATSATDGLPRLRTSTPGYRIDVSWFTPQGGVPTVRASAVPIPEPAAVALMGLGLLGAVCIRCRR